MPLPLLWPLLLTCLYLPFVTAEEQPVLFSHSGAQAMALPFDADDLRWLHDKQELVMGIAPPNFHPLEMTNATRDFEGVTADYLGLVAQSLGLAVRLRAYPDREAALAALQRGELDLLGSVTPEEAARYRLPLTRQYMVDNPVLVARQDLEPRHWEQLKGLRLAVPRNYRPLDALKARYPEATLLPFDAEDQAIAAVAFGQADLMLSNALSAQFLISKAYSDYVRVLGTLPPEGHGYAFALNPREPRLQQLFDTALERIPEAQNVSIHRRWGDRLMLGLAPLQFSDAEKQWIEQHPVVKVAVAHYLAPISYYDKQGNHLGITADLLTLLAAKTGIKFEVTAFDGYQGFYDAARDGRIQLVAGLSPDGARERLFHFTRPYLYSPQLLVSRDTADAPGSLAALAGKTLALTRGDSLAAMLEQKYPEIRIHWVKSALESLALLGEGSVDATLLPELVVSHNLPRITRDRLRITAAADLPLATQALAVRRDEFELFGILDKAIRSIPPDTMTEIDNNWRTKAPVATPSWHDYITLIYLIAGGCALLLLIALVWGLSLRRQNAHRQQAERALGDQMRFMEALINGTPNPIYVRDLERRMVLCNHSYLQTFGREHGEVIGSTVSNLPVEEQAEFDRDFQSILAGGQPVMKDRVVHIDGRTLAIYHWMLPFRNADGDIVGIIGGWIDISERQQLLAQLQDAKEAADEASRAKSTFLATMSHEIRTPMSAVIGLLELALKHADQGRLDRDSIEVAHGSAQGLLALIGDILDIARIESGRLSLSPERANLRQLLESVVRVFDGLARQKGLRLTLDLDNSANDDLLLDPQRLKQVLSNLVSNAIKFTDQGSVSVIARTEPEGDDLRVQIEVIDTGIGISAHNQQKLFQPFAQAPGNGFSTRSGTGLGLMISRTLCEMMGGQLQLESELGTGTRIVMALRFGRLEPLAAEPLRPIEPVAEPVCQALNVLVVDDSYAIRKLLSDQLAYLGHRVSQAEHGEQGLALWQPGAFDLVITDCNMPMLSGYQLARRIREREPGEQPTLIWGFTANAQPDERQRCLDAGMDDCLFKPITLGELDVRLRTIAPRATPAPEQAPVAPARACFDVKELEHFTGGDPGLTRRALEGILQSHRIDLQQVRSLLQSDGQHGVVEMAHRIRGAADIIRAHRLIDACERLEAAYRDNAPHSELRQLLQDLEATMIELDEELLRLMA
ncbi:transporter substrate-binding domain-containing protein [Pseudomonas sp. PDM13]|uniref:transporter substrate-binding domain-containing protein n=1 Tax=Pseudomonas sp. PDM13 TaxID=2769255 RepID=UPI0021E0B14F|nr:transporter substrate-binding domain-containing protein [Pseudomonas sp. PDM13]MCU9948894.1 transporter substrate-binding domain-containing protein [Pseudomonas sp. PDM13]